MVARYRDKKMIPAKSRRIAIIFSLIFLFIFSLPLHQAAADNIVDKIKNMFVFEFPHHPALKKTKESKMNINGCPQKIVLFEADINYSILAIADYYKKVLLERGWKQYTEYFGDNLAVLQFYDDEFRTVGISILKKSTIFPNIGKEGILKDEKDAILVYFNFSDSLKKMLIREQNESYDMPGKDIERIGRYPGSYRLQYIFDQNTENENVVYVVYDQNCLECVDNFYKERLAKEGWTILYSRHSNKEEMSERLEKDKEMSLKFYENLKRKRPDKEALIDKWISTKNELEKNKVLPEEVMTTYYQNNKADACSISISYMQARPETEEEKKIKDKLASLKNIDTSKQTCCNGDEIRKLILSKNVNIAPAQLEKFLEMNQTSAKIFNLTMIANGQVRPLFFWQNDYKEKIIINISYQPKKKKWFSTEQTSKGWFD